MTEQKPKMKCCVFVSIRNQFIFIYTHPQVHIKHSLVHRIISQHNRTVAATAASNLDERQSIMAATTNVQRQPHTTLKWLLLLAQLQELGPVACQCLCVVRCVIRTHAWGPFGQLKQATREQRFVGPACNQTYPQPPA